MAFCPVSSAQSVSSFRSPKSAYAATAFRAKGEHGNGAAAIRCGGIVKEHFRFHGQVGFLRVATVAEGISGWGGVSHFSTAPVSSWMATNLYSKGYSNEEASSVRCHTLGCTSFIRSGRQYSQLPSAAQLPMRPRRCPWLLRPGQSARKVMHLPVLSDKREGCSGVYALLKADV